MARRRIDMDLVGVALGRRPADVAVVNGRIVNVFTGEIYDGGLAAANGRIASIGDVSKLIGPDTDLIDAGGRYVVPGLIDGHQHVEDSRMSITVFSDVVVPAGTTSLFTGFDHVAVVAGLPGIRSFLDEAADLPLNVFWGAPFRLPYTDPPSAVGFPFGPAQHAETQLWPECIGIWEFTPDFLVDDDPDTIEALRMAHENGLPVFGSVPCAAERLPVVAAHVAAGLRVDHEAYTQGEMLEKMRMGLHVLLRDSPVEHFLPPLVGLLVDRPELAAKVGFCTDQANAEDVASNGHIDRLVREAIAAGIPPMTAIQMATINTATIYRIDDIVGSLAPGRMADVLLVDDLSAFRVDSVIAKGRLVASGGRMLARTQPPERPGFLVHPFTRRPVRPEDFAVRVDPDSERVTGLTMVLTDNAFMRDRRLAELDVFEGVAQTDPVQDVAMLSYVERFGKVTGPPAVAFVSGFGLRTGAIASSCTPDDDNILCVGMNGDDMTLAVNTLIERGGGDVAVADGQVLALVALPVGGIVSDLPPSELRAAQAELDRAVAGLGCKVAHPFMHLGVLCITGLPCLGISDGGLVDGVTRQFVSPIVSTQFEGV